MQEVAEPVYEKGNIDAVKDYIIKHKTYNKRCNSSVSGSSTWTLWSECSRQVEKNK